jgi:hypothetical protein
LKNGKRKSTPSQQAKEVHGGWKHPLLNKLYHIYKKYEENFYNGYFVFSFISYVDERCKHQ